MNTVLWIILVFVALLVVLWRRTFARKQNGERIG